MRSSSKVVMISAAVLTLAWGGPSHANDDIKGQIRQGIVENTRPYEKPFMSPDSKSLKVMMADGAHFIVTEEAKAEFLKNGLKNLRLNSLWVRDALSPKYISTGAYHGAIVIQECTTGKCSGFINLNNAVSMYLPAFNKPQLGKFAHGVCLSVVCTEAEAVAGLGRALPLMDGRRYLVGMFKAGLSNKALHLYLQGIGVPEGVQAARQPGFAGWLHRFLVKLGIPAERAFGGYYGWGFKLLSELTEAERAKVMKYGWRSTLWWRVIWEDGLTNPDPNPAARAMAQQSMKTPAAVEAQEAARREVLERLREAKKAGAAAAPGRLLPEDQAMLRDALTANAGEARPPALRDLTKPGATPGMAGPTPRAVVEEVLEEQKTRAAKTPKARGFWARFAEWARFFRKK